MRFGLQMVVDLFELDGWGCRLPRRQYADRRRGRIARCRKPDLLASFGEHSTALKDAGELIETVRADHDVAQTKLLIGGPPFRSVEGLWRELGADGCTLTSTEAVSGNMLVSV
ncbi:MAG: hypothetical protein R3E58_14930 [Phycisphaerae bacterium]